MTTTTTTPVDHSEHIVKLQRILHIIETEPRRWNQSNWITMPDGAYEPDAQDTYVTIGDGDVKEVVLNENLCGTAFCFAGWAAHLNPGVHFKGTSVLTVDGADRQQDVSEWAKRELGLIEGETILFSANNSLDEVRHYVRQITGRMLAEMFPPPPPKKYVVTVTTTSTRQVEVKASSEAAALAHAKDGFPAREGRTYEVALAPEPEPEPEPEQVSEPEPVKVGDYIRGYVFPLASEQGESNARVGEVIKIREGWSVDYGDALDLRLDDGSETIVWRRGAHVIERPPIKVGDYVRGYSQIRERDRNESNTYVGEVFNIREDWSSHYGTALDIRLEGGAERIVWLKDAHVVERPTSGPAAVNEDVPSFD